MDDELTGRLDAEADGPGPWLHAGRLELRLDALHVRPYEVALLIAGRERSGAADPVRGWRLRDGHDGDGGGFAPGQERADACGTEASVRAVEGQQDPHGRELLPNRLRPPDER